MPDEIVDSATQFPPRPVTPPGTCSLNVLEGAVLLGGVGGEYRVEIARRRDWGARVWLPNQSAATAPYVVRPFVVYGGQGEPDLIECMIAAAQETHRTHGGGRARDLR